MHRLRGFDYKRPFFYMVTLKRLPGSGKSLPFCFISDAGKVVANAVTEAFEAEIRKWVRFWRSVESVSPYVIMPDHLHLLIKLAAVEKAVSLAVVVGVLRKRLNRAYWAATSPADAGDGKTMVLPGGASAPPIFERAWHDWIVKKDGQLAAFSRYIRENPERAWLRRVNRRYFGKVRKVSFLGREWFAYGNVAILELPVLKAVKGHRTTKPGTAEWEAMVAGCGRIGPGGAGVGTFMSPLEKECGNAIAKAGGKWIVLSPEGFHERWHPPHEKERFCAEGRMLFLSLWPPTVRRPQNAELYQRCHEMGDIVVEGLKAADGAVTAKLSRPAKLAAVAKRCQARVRMP